MKSRIIKKSVLIFIIGLLILPNIAFAQSTPEELIKKQDNIELKQRDSEDILKSLLRHLNTKWEDTIILNEFDSQDNAVITIISESIKVKALKHLFFDLSTNAVKEALELAYLMLAQDPKLYVKKFEELTVDIAKEYAMDWLFQNEIKVGKGNLNFSYPALAGGIEQGKFSYIVVYKPIDTNKGEIIIRIYSPNIIKTPNITLDLQWLGDIEKVSPFIVEIKGEVWKDSGVYKWTKGPKIDIIFDEKVPSFDFKEPSVWDEVKLSFNKLKNLAKDTLGDTVKAGISGIEVVVEGLKSFWNTFKVFVPDSSPLGASISEVISTESETLITHNLEVVEESVKKGIAMIQESFPVAKETIKKQGTGGSEISEEEIQEILDDISERVDILIQQVNSLMPKLLTEKTKEEDLFEEESEETVEEEVEKELVEKEKLEDGKTAICSVEINTASKEELQKIISVGPATAQKIIEVRPFSSINDLVRVSGIGEVTLRKIIEQGCAYIEHYVGGGGGGGSSDVPPTYPKILISEIQIENISSSNDEFIELYNPNNEEVNISQWSIQKATSNGNISKKNFETGDTISANGYFLIVNSHASQNLLSLADMTHNSFSIASGNTIFLVASQEKIISGREENIKDKVGFSFDRINYKQPFSPETDTAIAPLAGQTLGRKWSETTSEYQDTNNNREDFEIQTPTPRAENSQPFLSQPILKVFPENLEFSIIEFATSSQSQTFIITNSGDGSLEWDSIIEYTSPSDADWLEIEPDSDTAPSNISAFLTQDSFNLTEGNYFAKIIITAEGAEDSPQNVEVELSVKQSEEEEEEEEEPPTLEVVINEIAWMGTKASSSDEWIELYNNSDQDINLFGWKLKSSDGSPDIIFGEIPGTSILITTTISTQGFYLLERTNDDTIRDIPADWFGSFGNGLKNNPNCEILSLYNQNDNLIDQTVCLDGNWPAGRNEKIGDDWIRISMERIDSMVSGTDPENWANNNLIIRNGKDAADNNIWGTPRAENSINSPTSIIQLPFNDFDKITLGIESSPYIIKWDLTIPKEKTLIIDPGVVLKFDREGLRMIVDGTLKAIGTGNNKITFTCLSDNPYPGCWSGVRFTETSVDSKLDNTIFEYAGYEWHDKTAVYVENSLVTIRNSLFRYNKNKGIYLVNSDSLINNSQFIENATHCAECHNKFISIGVLVSGGSPTIQNSLFKKNGYGVKIENNSTALIKDNIFEKNEYVAWLNDSSPSFVGNQAINNNLDGILTGGNITQNTTWSNNLPYVLFMEVNIFQDITLTLDPGAILKFDWDGLRMIVDGTLKAIGTEDNKITFTCLSDNPYPGCWSGVRFTETSVNSELDNTIFEYAGYEWHDKTAVYVENSLVTIRNSLFRYNKNTGIYLVNSDSLIDNSQFIENATYCAECHNKSISIGVLVSGGSPTIQNSLFKKNGYGVVIRDNGAPLLNDLIFGMGDEANVCNIYKENECINPLP